MRLVGASFCIVFYVPCTLFYNAFDIGRTPVSCSARFSQKLECFDCDAVHMSVTGSECAKYYCPDSVLCKMVDQSQKGLLCFFWRNCECPMAPKIPAGKERNYGTLRSKVDMASQTISTPSPHTWGSG